MRHNIFLLLGLRKKYLSIHHGYLFETIITWICGFMMDVECKDIVFAVESKYLALLG